MSFETPLTLSGPLRSPRQMLQEQEYGGHVSIHDDIPPTSRSGRCPAARSADGCRG